jgi:hypothetical protein
MYRRPILCTLYGAVDFLNVLKKGCWWRGVLLVHSEIYYIPVDDGWEEVLVHNVVHYVPVLHYVPMALASLVPFQGPKKSRFSGPTPSNAPRNDVAPLKIITYRAIKTTGTLIVIMSSPSPPQSLSVHKGDPSVLPRLQNSIK